MLEMLMQWYRRRFSDPEAIALLVILVAGFGIIFFFSGLLAPLLVAIVLAYLLEWPTVRLQSIGCSRPWATSIVLILFVGILLLMAFVVLPIAWQQGIYLIRDMPGMLNKLSDFAATLPRRYPALMDAGIIDAMAENMRSRMLSMGDSVVKFPRLVGRFADHCRLSGAGTIDGLLPAERQRADAERRSPGAAAQPWTGRTGVEGDESTNHQLYPRQSAGDDRGRDRHLAGVLALWAELFAAAGGAGRLLGTYSVHWRICGDHSGGWRGAIPVWCWHGILELLRGVSDYSGAGRQPVSTGVVFRSG